MSLIKAEWKALLQNRKVLIAVIGVLFIPLMYSGGYLSAFWDPYGQLDQLPVAVVNQDEGAIFEGEPLDVGSELIETLKEDSTFNWHYVEKDEAEKGLKNHDYYMIIEIPKNFSENATTLLDDRPQNLELSFKTNKGYNFISGQIGESAVEKIKEEVSHSLTKTYAEGLFENIKLMADGISEANDGSQKINDGVNELKEGSSTLNDNLKQLVTKSITFKEGLNEAEKGTVKLSDGMSEVENGLTAMLQGQNDLYNGSVETESGSTQLVAGLKSSLEGIQELEKSLPDLTTGTQQLNTSAPELVTGTEQLAEGSLTASEGAAYLSENLSGVTNKVNEMVTKLEGASIPEEQKAELMALAEALNSINKGQQELATNLTELTAGAEKLHEKVVDLPEKSTQLYEGTVAVQEAIDQIGTGQEKLYSGALHVSGGQSQITSGLATFGERINQMKTGVSRLTNGGVKLESGIHELANGAVALQDGSVQLADGSTKIDNGLTELSDGTNELSSKLAEATEDTKDVKGTEDQYDMIAEPVQLSKEEINKVSNYGTGLAPYFLSLALFVGTLLFTVVFPLRKPAGEPSSGMTWFISKFSILFVVSIFQAVLADILLLYGLGLEVKNIGLFFLFSILTSLTFMAIVQFFVTTMADPGRFIAIIILILQLTTSAGTFPLELLPDVFQVINHWLPMTYSVAGLRAIISTGDFTEMWNQAYVLIGFFAMFIIGTIIYFSLKVKKSSVQEDVGQIEG
ncbi:YhgE/Pip domain-containing protein [Metabacillus sp. B2-18]|uniref:YhgE/Pip domain-containing protein n=1 Tax=Metabacillus sp. B2-18 TaxID=2897333 RepID=UPI001E33CA39|nr:YhgE/Pip domain-containing protein [Metabacillus sp. B2-18]UGB31643.1 YhgE/Pip domain-containing protein [Metabacillus sp. B2-18]